MWIYNLLDWSSASSSNVGWEPKLFALNSIVSNMEGS